MTDTRFSFTIAEVADVDQLAVKRITRRRDGAILKSHYDNVYLWRFEPAECGWLETMAVRLQSLATESRRCLVMGEPIEGLDLTKPHRRLWADPKIANSPRHQPRLDAARLRRRNRSCRPWPRRSPCRCGAPCPRMRVAARIPWRSHDRHSERQHRPAGRRRRAVQAVRPSRYGSAARDDESLGAGREGLRRAAVELGADPGRPTDLHRAANIHRHGRSGSRPLPRTILPGSADTVSLVVDRYTKKATEIRARIKFAAIACRRKMADNCSALTLGGETGFFEPLTRGIGAAVRVGASPPEIEGFVVALLKQRADPARIQQYNSAWISRSIQSFRRRDAVARAAMAAEFPQEA